jgi:NAD(P)H dehydrogenase (quinone)
MIHDVAGCTGTMNQPNASMSPQCQYERSALIVVSHHRSDSLTSAVAKRAGERLDIAGFRVDIADLHSEGFDPRNSVIDEPDYGNRDKVYSATVQNHIRRIYAADVIIPVFPVWWFGLPALLKGWVDRVWNYGLAYGRRDSPMTGKRMLWLGLAAITAQDQNVDLVHHLLDETLRRGISDFCGIPDAQVTALLDSEAQGLTGAAREHHYREFFAQAEAAVDKIIASV